MEPAPGHLHEVTMPDEQGITNELGSPEPGPQIPEHAQKLASPDAAEQLAAATWFRQLLVQGGDSCNEHASGSSSETDEDESAHERARDEIVSAGLVPRFIELLQSGNPRRLQCQVTLVMAAIASGPPAHADVAMAAGVLPPLLWHLAAADGELMAASCQLLSALSATKQPVGSKFQKKRNFFSLSDSDEEDRSKSEAQGLDFDQDLSGGEWVFREGEGWMPENLDNEDEGHEQNDDDDDNDEDDDEDRAVSASIVSDVLQAVLAADPPVLPRLVELLGEQGAEQDQTMSIMRAVNDFVTSGTDEQTQRVLDSGVALSLSRLLDGCVFAHVQVLVWFVLSNIAT
jgi:hypothetical protein